MIRKMVIGIIKSFFEIYLFRIPAKLKSFLYKLQHLKHNKTINHIYKCFIALLVLCVVLYSAFSDKYQIPFFRTYTEFLVVVCLMAFCILFLATIENAINNSLIATFKIFGWLCVFAALLLAVLMELNSNGIALYISFTLFLTLLWGELSLIVNHDAIEIVNDMINFLVSSVGVICILIKIVLNNYMKIYFPWEIFDIIVSYLPIILFPISFSCWFSSLCLKLYGFLEKREAHK